MASFVTWYAIIYHLVGIVILLLLKIKFNKILKLLLIEILLSIYYVCKSLIFLDMILFRFIYYQQLELKIANIFLNFFHVI